MYFNTALIRLKPTETEAGMGYVNRTFDIKDGRSVRCDKQPYSSEAAKKEYGLDVSNVMWRVFIQPKHNIAVGDFLRFIAEETVYTVVMAHRWENHTELVLATVKRSKTNDNS
jgi:hypothetical protein